MNANIPLAVDMAQADITNIILLDNMDEAEGDKYSDA
jgi:hypothetical protein